MTGRIVAGRQEPEPGSRRERAMALVKSWLLAHPTGGTYPFIARRTKLSVNAVVGACLDLTLFDPDFVVFIPAPRNGYTARGVWNRQSQAGEGNQGRHAATRLERLAIRWEKAAQQETDLGKAQILRIGAQSARAEAQELAMIAEVLG